MLRLLKKAGVAVLSALMIFGCLSFSLPKAFAAAATIREWEGKTENLKENGREGIAFNSQGEIGASAYTAETYNMNEGITLRFRVTSIPGIQGEVDAWFAFMLQNGTDSNPEGGNTGFKFLLREADPKDSAGMAIQRFVCVPGGKPLMKLPLISPVPMLNNEHYISIVQRGNGNGFLVSIDGVVTDYYDDDDAFMIEDLTQARVVIKAYVSPNSVKDCAPWEVEIDKIRPLTQTEAWKAFGTAVLEEQDSSTRVAEATVKSGANSATFYKTPVDVEKKLEIKLKIEQCPVFTDEFSDAYIGIILSKEEYATDINATDALIAVFKLKDRNTLLGNFGQGSMAAGLDKELGSVLPNEELTVAFGFEANGIAVVTLGGKIVGYSKNIKANNFLDKKGYISIVTYNNGSSKCNWAFTVSSVAETAGELPVWQEDSGENKDSGGGGKGAEKSSCKSSILAGGAPIAALGVLVGGAFLMRKRSKENKE